MNSENTITSTIERKQFEKTIDLLKMGQAVNLSGSWEWELETDNLLWTDVMFQLCAIPLPAGNIISFEDAFRYIHTDDREMVKEQFEKAKLKALEFQFRIIAADKKEKCVSVWASAVKDDNGEVKYLRGTCRDITRQHRAESALMELNKSFNYAEKIANMGNWNWNLEKDLLVFSDNLYRILGCKPHEFEPTFENLRRFVCKDDLCRWPGKEQLAQQGEEPETTELRFVTKTGQEINVKVITKILTDKEKTILGVIQDITQEVLLRKELEERKLFAEMLFDNSVDLISAYDKDLNVIAWNKICEDRYQLKKEQVLGKNIVELYPQIKGRLWLQDIEHALQGQFIHRMEQASNTISGYFDYYMLPLETGNGIIGVLAISHDMTNIRNATNRLDELNRSLEQKNNELKQSNSELASFSYIASHDLQEPLRKIQTFSHRIVETEIQNLSPQGKDYLKRMEAASTRMQTLIEDLLAFSRTNTGKKKPETADLNKILEEVKGVLKDHIEEKSALITSDPLPVANVIPFQFRQILENLLLNAIKYSKPDVQPQIVFSYEEIIGSAIPLNGTVPDDSYHKISISDNGIGFDQQYAEKIFELFQRLHGKHEYPGTGLGLAICRKIIQNHNGFLVGRGEPGVGAVFTIYLPA